MAASAFVPISDVESYFSALKTEAPEVTSDYVTYFDQKITGIRRRKLKSGKKRKAVAPRYAIQMWNQYDAAISGQAKTNKVSEGWHNRFHILIGWNHPGENSFIKEMKKEQGDTEIAIMELMHSRRVKAAPKKKMGGDTKQIAKNSSKLWNSWVFTSDWGDNEHLILYRV